MTPDTDFAIPERLFVPPELRAKLNQVIRSATRLVVSEKLEGGAEKVNGLRLRCTLGQLPHETLDEIAEAVTAIMHAHWSEQGTEDEDGVPPVEFVVSAEHYASEGGKKKRKRSQFEFLYKGDECSLYDDAAEETLTLEDRALQRAFETLERQNGQLMQHNDLLHNLFLSMIDKMGSSMQALGGASTETMKHALPMFFGGIQAMVNARTMEFSQAKAEAQASETTKRVVGGLNAIAPFLSLAATQFLASKFGMPPDAAAQVLSSFSLGGGGMGGVSPSSPNRGPAPTASSPSADGAVDDEPPRHLVAHFAGLFGESLTNTQRRELGRKLTAEQVAIFDDLLCSTTDDEAFELYQHVVAKLGAKLGLLRQMLEPSQVEIFNALVQALQHHAHNVPS